MTNIREFGDALIETGDFARLETVGAEMNAVAADSGDPGVKAHAALVGLWIRLFMSPEGWAEDALSEATRWASLSLRYR
jgi:hypothetical protein